MNRVLRRLLLVASLCLAGPVPADQALQGIDTLIVRYDGIGTDLAPYGLDRSKLESAVDELLAQAGIRVLHDQGPADVPTVTVALRLQTTLYHFYLYNIKLTLEAALPLPEPGAWTTLQTWSDGETGAIQPDKLGRLHATALQIVQRFLDERAAQNG